MKKHPISIKDLSLKEKIAQLFLMGFHGQDCEKGSDLERMIRDYSPGGVILFDKDMINHEPVHNIKSPSQVQNLTNKLQEISKIPLFISIDQEGGIVNRLKPEYGFPTTRSHQNLEDIDNIEETQNEGLLISGVLKRVGINMNFAPCVDLSLNKESSIIAGKERSFGSNAGKVGRHAEAYIKGHKQNNILTACKHFPGHGSASGDTHTGFVDVTETWCSEELEPYKKLIVSDLCPIVMTSHIFNEKLDAKYPASLSKNTITNLLRDQLGFDGVIISDDMQMKAITEHYSFKESLRLGLQAGLDMFCFGNNLQQESVKLEIAIQTIEEMLADNEISEDRIDKSVERILKIKNQYLA